ncbi:MAG: imidazolonepropionase [Deltaproteobacteria bacterium]|nr:imidazolonepropionase [Deltaproteobacteria bacterium]
MDSTSPSPYRMRIKNARIATCAGHGSTDEARLDLREHASIVIERGTIAYVGPDDDCPAGMYHRVVDVGGRLVTPGLVDPHTHLVFAGTRAGEFRQKMEGVDYRTIAKGGGGIGATVRATREATDDSLTASVLARMRVLASCGVTLVEIKSGYGLTVEHELRLLRIAREASHRRMETAASRDNPKLAGQLLPRTTTTLLGAHAVPPEHAHDRAGYVELVATEMVRRASELRRLGLRETTLADACDVYLDENAFTVEEARTILTAAKAAGLRVRAHVGQFADVGGAELLAELGGLSCDHLEVVSDEGLRAMAAAGTRAVLLPVAWRTLKQRPPDAARMRAHGVAIAVGTDANPGTSACLDPLAALGLAVRDAGLSPSAALLAVTREAAAAVGAETGRLEVERDADLCVWDHDDPSVFGYVVGGLRPAWAISRGMTLVGGPEELGAAVFR